jgi:signal transduction histidine kinase
MKRARWAFSSTAAKPRLAAGWIQTRALVLLLCLDLLVHLGLIGPSSAQAADPTLQLTTADFILAESPEPPPDSAPWQPQPLPDDWRVSRPGTYGYGWYRLRFELPAEPDQLFAAYMPLLQTVGALYVNGVYAGQSGTFGRPPPGFHPRWSLYEHPPQLFSIRPDLLRAGTNTLHLRLWVYKGARGTATAITLGAEPLVRAMYERRLFATLTGLQMLVIFSIGFGLSMLLLWLRRPHESMYGYFGLTALVFPIWIAGKYLIADPPIPSPYWAVIVRAGLDGYSVLMCFFALRYGGWRLPRLERVLLAYVAISVFVNYHFYSGGEGWITEHWWLLTFVTAATYVTIFWAIAWQRRAAQTICLAAASSLKLAVAINENLLPYPIDLPRYMPYSYMPMFIMIGWILIDRFVKALNESEALNTELEKRVAQKHADLQENYQRMQQMERQQAIVEERQRIMRDMHDGIGAHLISTLSQVEHGRLSSEEMAAALRECIEDLRLTIDSLEPTDDDLLAVLGNLRYRLEPRLKRCGIELDWQVQDVPKLACLDPKSVLHILRILQEGFTNILRHADADRVSVETGVDQGKVFIRVKDNGHGFASDHKGHGLASMKHRAQAIGGQLDIQPSPAGTTLNLLLPISSSSTSS